MFLIYYLLALLRLLDGAGLFCGVLKHLLDRGPDCPKVLAATHFYEIFKPKFLDAAATAIITFLHMQVIFTTTDGEVIADGDSSIAKANTFAHDHIGPGETITYLYR